MKLKAKTKKTFWDRFAFVYDSFESLNKTAYQSMLSEIAALVLEQAEVLECAAGTGEISIALAPKAKSVLCTDLSAPMLDRARKKAKKRGFDNIVFAERDIFHLPETNESFDVVVAANVIHLLDSPNEALSELWRVTKPGGTLIIPTFLTKESGAGFKIILKLYKLFGFDPKRSFSMSEYKNMLENCGLTKPDISMLEGRVPVGLAVFRKENGASELIEKAKKLIQNKECTVAAVTKVGAVLTASGSSVRPLYRIYTEHRAELKGAAVADRIIGRAAACILADAQVAEAYAFLMSETGLELLKKSGIKAGYAKLVPVIENAKGDDMCPMEKTVDGIEDNSECVRRIGEFIANTNYNG